MKRKFILAASLVAATPLAQAATETLDEVVVTATRSEQVLTKTLSHTSVITRKDIDASQAADVPSLLKSLAGVEIYQSGGIGKQSSLFMRGSNSSHTLVLLDGVRINSATAGTTAIDQLMLDQIERIEVVRGNVSSLYGSEAIGGVIQIFTKRGKGEPSFNGSVGAGTHNTQRASAGFGGEAASTTFNVQVSKYKTGGVSAINPALATNVNPDKDGYDNTSASVNARHAFNNDHSVSTSAFQSNADVRFDNYGFFASAADDHVSRSLLSKFALTSENRVGENWFSKLQWAQGVDDLRNYVNGLPDWDVRTSSNQLGWQNTLTLGEHNLLLLGAETLSQRVASNTAYTQTNRKVNALFGGYTALYGSHQLQINLRQDRYSDFGKADTGLAGYGYAISDAWRVSGSISTAFKAPTFNDMYLPAAWGGNPSLRPERSHNSELGAHYAANAHRFDIVYFDNHIADLIQYQFPLTQNVAQARIEGTEVSYGGQFGDTGVRLAATQQNPRDAQTGQTLLRRAKTFSSFGVTQQLGALKVGGEWQHSGVREDNHISAFPTQRIVLASYDIVNLSANYALDQHFDLSARVDNLFNLDYMLAHGYNTLGRTLYIGLSYR